MLTKHNQINFIFTLFFTSFFWQHNAQSQEVVLKPEKDKKTAVYKGSLDFGATVANGNSKEQSIQSNFDLKYNFNKKVSNIIAARAENQKTNDVRTREKYYVNNQTRKNISAFNFKFLEMEFVSDRFGGYNYRTSETIGIGRKLLDDEKLKLTIQSSIGLRQVKLITGEKNNNVIIRFGSNFSVDINEHVSFSEAIDVSFDKNATITRSDTNLKILISKSLYLKFGVLIQHVSEVPANTKKSDVTSGLKVGYEF